MMIRRHSFVVVASALLVAVPAFPCGGPGSDIVDRPLVPVESYLNTTLHDDEYQVRLRDELRFLEPFRAEMPDSVGRLYTFAYETGGYLAEMPDDSVRRRVESDALAPSIAAIARGAFPEAVSAARAVVDAVLNEPAGLALAHHAALRTAVEITDIAPRLRPADASVAARYFASTASERATLGATGVLPPLLREGLAIRSLSRDSAAAYADAHPATPRLGSLRFVALQEAMRTGIPNGWGASIRDSMPAGRWAQLERVHDEWLRTFASHPMADYVRLSKVRLFYFKGDPARAWNELLEIYPRHRLRLLGEMRYLVYMGMLPPSLDDRRIDWPLRAALLMQAPVTAEQWTSYWRASAAQAAAPWAATLQERLLWRAIEQHTTMAGALPAGFPA
jgi:hypothetical protein